MKFIISLVILIFSLQYLAKAEDIRDFQIDGMSIGDSILLNYSEDQVFKIINSGSFYDQKGKYYEAYFMPKNNSNYDYIKITWKQNDKNYKIYGIGGIIEFHKNFTKCIDKQKIIIKDIENLFYKAKKTDYGKNKSVYDETGDSYFIETNFEFENGDIARIYCSYWSDKMYKEKNYVHTLNFLLNSAEFLNFLRENY